MNTAEFLTISAAIVPDRTAVVGPNERVSYQELQSRVNKLAQALQASGIARPVGRAGKRTKEKGVDPELAALRALL